jgi:AcrR family transcriptional regulator
VTEALALIDEQGIAAASMRSVGERLGVKAMSLYRYLDGRDALFDAVVDHVVDELSSDPEVHLVPTSDWRDYLSRLAWGVRRYALRHPHAFPIVATRPPEAPWLNPPLRSLRWVEAMLAALRQEGFTDAQVLFTYRSFNSFLLGYLLLETSGLALRDPKPGDGSFQSGDTAQRPDPVEPADPVPGQLSPTRSKNARRAIRAAATAEEQVDPAGGVDPDTYPTIHRLRAGLTEEHYEDEFRTGLNGLLDRIGANIATGAKPARNPRRGSQ